MRLLAAVSVLATATAVFGQRITVNGQCAATDTLFDSQTLTCRECTGTGRTFDTSTVGPYGDASSCRCEAGSVEDPLLCASSVPTNLVDYCTATVCTACPAGEFASVDGTRCMPCDGTTAVDGTTDCTCVDSTHVLVETSASGAELAAKACIPCPTGSRVFTTDTTAAEFVVRVADPYQCQTCGNPAAVMDTAGRCTCSAGTTELVGLEAFGTTTCAQTTTLQHIAQFYDSDSNVLYPRFVSSTGSVSSLSTFSRAFDHMYRAAAAGCLEFRDDRDRIPCATLANLCVLNLYDRRTAPCRLYEAIALRRRAVPPVHAGWEQWPEEVPFLFYGDNAAPNALSSQQLDTEYSFDDDSESGTRDTLQLVLGKYTLNGTFLGFEVLRNQLFYCGGSSSALPRWLGYGFSANDETQCDLSRLLTTAVTPENSADFAGLPAMHFYDLYIVDSVETVTGDPIDLPVDLQPVPVRIRQLRKTDGGLPNDNDSEDDDQLTRRFFLVDPVSGTTTPSSDTPTYVHFATRIMLTITAQDDPSKILPPVLTIEYEAREAAQFDNSPDYSIAEVDVEVEYVGSTGEYDSVVLSFFVICLIVVVLFTGVRMFNWSRRSTRQGEDANVGVGVCGRLIVVFAGVFSRVYFWFLFALTSYWLLFYKLQDKVFTLLPSDSGDEYRPLMIMIWLVLIGQALRVGEIIIRQTSIDMYFIDWEKSRGKLLGAGRDFLRDGGHGMAPHKDAPVSVWRTIFGANEWAELQVTRRSSLEFTIVMMLVLLEGANLKNVATPQPNATNLDGGDLNPALRFANTAFWWMLVVFAQVLYRGLLGERYLGESPTQQFIDLCTVEKVSLVLLPDKYHGYYLHCDAPYEFADGTMDELSAKLEDEQEAKRIGRGLKGSPIPDCQTFEIYLPAAWRHQYDRVFQRLALGGRGRGDGTAMLSHGRSQPQRGSGSASSHDRVLASAQISRFLKGFIAETDPSFPRFFRPKTYLQRFLSIPPDMNLEANMRGTTFGASSNAGGNVIFHTDPNFAFEELIFRGVELDLVLLDILIWSVMDLIAGRVLASALVTYVLSNALVKLRHTLGQRNVAKKSLVDDRFLF